MFAGSLVFSFWMDGVDGFQSKRRDDLARAANFVKGRNLVVLFTSTVVFSETVCFSIYLGCAQCLTLLT